MSRMAAHGLTDVQLAAAKRQLKGQIGIACDAREAFALSFAKSFLHYGWERDIQRLFRCIDDITAEQVQQVAHELFAPDNILEIVYK